jgi:hypothetical protein
MYPEEYKSTLLRLAESDEDMKILLGLFPLLKGYTTEETFVRNFSAITGRDCRGLLKELRRRGIVKIGTHNEYMCLSGYEEFFDEIVRGYAAQPGDLVKYFENAVEAGDKAALKMLDLLLKTGIYGTRGFTQYELIRADISEMFSSEVFQSLEEDLLRKRLCIYGKKRDEEFLDLCQSEDVITSVKERLMADKRKKLAELPLIKTLEAEIENLVATARSGIKAWSTRMAESAGMSKENIEATVGYFSGFTMNDSFLVITGNMLIGNDRLYLVITDSLSRYDIREWRDNPVVFITEEVPKWVWKSDAVFKQAYPKLSDRKLAILAPNKAAYANFKHDLLSELARRLGVAEITELSKAGSAPPALRKTGGKGHRDKEELVY